MIEDAKYKLLLFSMVMGKIFREFPGLPVEELYIRTMETIQAMDNIASGKDASYKDLPCYDDISAAYDITEVLCANQGRAGYGIGGKWPEGVPNDSD